MKPTDAASFRSLHGPAWTRRVMTSRLQRDHRHQPLKMSHLHSPSCRGGPGGGYAWDQLAGGAVDGSRSRFLALVCHVKEQASAYNAHPDTRQDRVGRTGVVELELDLDVLHGGPIHHTSLPQL